MIILLLSSINNYLTATILPSYPVGQYISPMQIIPWGPEGFEFCWQMGSVYFCLYRH